MFKYIISVLFFFILVLITLFNLKSTSYTTINLIFTTTPPIPGILLLYLGILIGAIITFPIIIMQSHKSKIKASKKLEAQKTKEELKSNQNQNSTNASAMIQDESKINSKARSAIKLFKKKK